MLELRQQVEEGRKVEENIRKKYLEKEEQHQVEVNILKGKLEEKDKLLRFQDSNKILDDILSSKNPLLSKLVLVFMKLSKVNLAHRERKGILIQNLK